MSTRSVPETPIVYSVLRELGYSSETSVLDFQAEWSLPATGTLDRTTIMLILDAHEAHHIGKRHQHPSPCNAVKGTVTSASGEAAPGLEVQLVAQGFRTETIVGSAQTDDKGGYEVAHSRADAKTHDALVVRVLDGKTVAAQSAPQFEPAPLLQIDLTVDESHVHGPTEYERIGKAVAARIGKVAVSDLQAADLAFLSGVTGFSTDDLTDLLLATRLSVLGKIEAAFFYALLREGTLSGGSALTLGSGTITAATPTQPLYYEVVLTDGDTLRAAVAAAVAARLVPATITGELDGILKTLAQSTAAAQSYTQTTRPTQLLNVVAANVAAGKLQEVLSVVQAQGTGDPAALASGLGAIAFVQGDGSAAPASGNADVAQALSQLLSSNPQLLGDVQMLTRLGGAATTATTATTAATTAAGSATASTAATTTAAAATTAAATRPAFDAAALKGAPAQAGRMERLHPTASFSANLASADAKRAPANRDAMVALLQANPNFNLATDNVDKLLASQPAAATGASTQDTTALRNQLKATQRVFKLAPTYGQTTALLDAGVHSAGQIAAMGKLQFAKRFSGAFTPEQASAVHDKAVAINTATAMLAANLRSISGAAAAAITPAAVTESLKLVSANFPNLKTLFQTTDLCDCQDCNAVDSASAYLVDVLSFISNRQVVDTTGGTGTPTKDALTVLFARRPDLGEIDLSCDNTNVPLPYIDVVCELLEQAVAPDQGLAYTGAIAVGAAPATLLSALQGAGLAFTSAAFIQEPTSAGDYYVRDAKAVCKLVGSGTSWKIYQLRQTFESADELAAMPEYVNANAYANLQSAKIAFHLPYDLFHEEARAYFGQFGVTRDALMRALAVGGAPTAAAIAADALDIAYGEHADIITADASSAGQAAFWNTGATDPATLLSTVDTFLTRTELQYTDLQDLLARKFINPSSSNLYIKLNQLSCDTTQQTIVNLDDAALDRIHRFLRLQKRLGWSIDALDRAIMAPRIGNGSIDDNLLIQLAAIEQLQARLNITVDEIITWFGTLATDGNPSRYAQLFLSATTNGTVNPALQPAAVAANTTVTLESVDATLALAFGVTQSDIDAIIAALTAPLLATMTLNPNPPLANDVVSFTSLAAVYSHVSLARALNRSAGDVLLLETMTGINPLATPLDAQRLVAESDKLAAAAIKPADLQFYLSFQASNLDARTLKDAAVTSVLQGVQQALQAAWTQTTSPFDPNQDADNNESGVLTVVAKLPNVTTAQVAKLKTLLDNSYTDTTQTPQDFVSSLLTPFGLDLTAIDSAITALLALDPPAPAPTAAQLDSARNALMQAILTTVCAYLYQQARATAVATAIANGLGLDATLAATIVDDASLTISGTPHLLLDVLAADALIDESGAQPPVLPAIAPGGSFDNLYAAIRLVRQIAAFTATMKSLTASDVAWLLENDAALGWLALDGLPYQAGGTPIPYAQWSQLQDAIGLFTRYPAVVNPDDATQPFTMETVLSLVLTAGTTPAQLLTLLATVTGWPLTLLTDLDARFGLSSSGLGPYQLPATYLQLEAAVVALRKLGSSVADGAALLDDPMTAANTQTLRQALKTRYPESAWLGVLKQIYDPLRQQKRDALVAWLLANNPGFESSDDLFDYFLVDVEMCSCAPTSRIVSAHGTVQLFTQRCLLGIEPTCVADVAVDDGWNQWQWMQQYRLWQANRQVFLYPENWIQPTLRDDKSEPFTALENALQQSNLDDDSITTATNGYLEALDQLAFLEVVSSYYDESTYTTYVFARTKGGDPPTYFYRQFVKEQTWTPWQQVKLDIKGNHLVAFIRNDRLTLAWPIFTANPNPSPEIAIPATSDQGTSSTQTPDQQWQIQIAISELANGQWTPSVTSQQALYWPDSPSTDPLVDQSLFRFVPMNLLGSGFSILCTYDLDAKPGQLSGNWLVGLFSLIGCKGYPQAAQENGDVEMVFFPQFEDCVVANQRFTENSASVNQLTIDTFILRKWVPILERTPYQLRVTTPQQLGLIDYILLLLELVAAAQQQTETGLAEFARINTRILPIPLGTFMPYFVEDGYHNYVVVPNFGAPRRELIDGGTVTVIPAVRRTFSDVFQLVQTIVNLLEQHLPALQSGGLAAFLQALYADASFQTWLADIASYADLKYGIEFDNFYHPLVCPLRSTLYSDGIDALLARDTQLQKTSFDFNVNYKPQPVVNQPYPHESIAFGRDDVFPVPSYASYNWELFFHMPFEVATRLTAAQQFQSAMEWFHYIFNPMDASSGSVPQKYWRTKPFYLRTTADYTNELIQNVMNGLDPTGSVTAEMQTAVENWRENPYEPFVVARSRTVAFQQAVLMQYLNNLIAWGDSLFTQDTMETVNQATQLYILADKLLGPKPRIVPPLVTPPTETFNQLQAKSIDIFGNAMLDLESLIPDVNLLPQGGNELPTPLPLTMASLYFCIPPNPTMLGYWDTVADRLFKIRNCQDINGVQRTLALFAPPIDPGALVAAAAAGLSPSQIVAGLGAPLPFYRFSAMSQKAAELAQLVSGFGNSLLSTLEKRDSEALQRLKATQEIAVQNAMLAVKQQQLADAQQQIDVLQKGIAVTTAKSQYYHARQFMIAGEETALSLNQTAIMIQTAATVMDAAAAAMHLLPSFSIGVAGFGGSPSFNASFGGENIAGAMSGFSSVIRSTGGLLQSGAGIASTLASYQRRQDDWTFQAQQADLELVQLQSQVAQAQIRVQTAQNEVAAQQLQLDNANQVNAFLQSKFTNQELYQYLSGQLSATYFAAYQLAVGVAHNAERCYQLELGNETTFIGYGYWDNLHKGLLAGDVLLSDIRRMEVGYLQANQREYELTKNVSLAQLDPLALLELKNTGSCIFSLPETLFDLDHPGQYFRRLKTVSLTIPCVAGPYATVSCKLSIVGNRYRKTATSGVENPAGGDKNFVYNVGTIQSIATSQAQSDSGLFQLDFKDERYLPFEYQGAISSWRLEMPTAFMQLDYQTITDVILNLKYTARDGGSTLRGNVEQGLATALQAMLVDAQSTGLYQGFNVRLEYPDAWFALQQTGTTSITVTSDQLPYFTQAHGPLAVANAQIVALANVKSSTLTLNVAGSAITLTADPNNARMLVGTLPAIAFGAPITIVAGNVSQLQELALIVNYTLGS